MHQPTLLSLPLAAHGKNGWPWTKGTNEFPSHMPDGYEWPKLSIVTPSYNQGKFIEETIRSVLLQNYPNLEYIIIDGGSTDESISIIKKYQPWLAYWVSEKDEGQSDAINKGFAKSTGNIMGWINSDDLLMPYALFEIASKIDTKLPEWFTSPTIVINERGNRKFIHTISQVTANSFYTYQIDWIPQPSTYWTRLMWDQVGSINTRLRYVMDVDLFFRMLQITTPKIHTTPLSCYRVHPCAKTIGEAELSIEEYAVWFCQEVLGVRHVSKGRLDIDFTDMIKQSIAAHAKIQHIEKHIIIGRALKLWRRYINSNLGR